nr:hypothetical protein [uncultured Ruminococcus sp.]
MKKGVIITGSIIAVVIIGLVCFYESFRPGGYGEEYHKVWKCDDYNIQIDSYARKFPDNTNREKITIDGKKYQLEFYGGSFAIGTLNNYKEDGEEYSKLDSVVEGDNYDKGFFDFTLHINKVVDSKYNYLKGKTLVFHKE